MLPGFILSEADAGWESDDKMVCTVEGNQLPFAIGFMEQSGAAAWASGMKGRGLKVGSDIVFLLLFS